MFQPKLFSPSTELIQPPLHLHQLPPTAGRSGHVVVGGGGMSSALRQHMQHVAGTTAPPPRSGGGTAEPSLRAPSGGRGGSSFYDVSSPQQDRTQRPAPHTSQLGGLYSSPYRDVDAEPYDDDDGDNDLMAMTEEEKQQFAAQLGQWEVMKRQQRVASQGSVRAAAARPRIPSTSPSPNRHPREDEGTTLNARPAHNNKLFDGAGLGTAINGGGDDDDDDLSERRQRSKEGTAAAKAFVQETLHRVDQHHRANGATAHNMPANADGSVAVIGRPFGSQEGGGAAVAAAASQYLPINTPPSASSMPRHHQHKDPLGGSMGASSFYKRAASWKDTVEKTTLHLREERDTALAAECSFAPLINKKSSRIVSQTRTAAESADASMATASNVPSHPPPPPPSASASSPRHQHSIASESPPMLVASPLYQHYYNGGSSTLAAGYPHDAAAFKSSVGKDTTPSARMPSAAGGGGGGGARANAASVSTAASETPFVVVNNTQQQQLQQQQQPHPVRVVAPSLSIQQSSMNASAVNTSAAAAASTRLYSEHQRQQQRKEALASALREEEARECTFAPAVCSKPWTSSVTPRYLDAYVAGQMKKEGADDEEAGGDYDDGQSSQYTMQSRRQDRAGSIHRQGSSVRSASASRYSHHTSSATRGQDAQQAVADEACTFKPVTNSLSRLQQYYNGPRSVHGGAAAHDTSSRASSSAAPRRRSPSNNGHANHSAAFDASTATAMGYTQPALSIDSLRSYLSIPAHERLAMDAEQKRVATLEHQRAVEAFIKEEAKPIINVRSASVVAMAAEEHASMNPESNRKDSSHHMSSSSSTTVASFLSRLEASTAKRDAKRNALMAAVKSTETPFSPNTNKKYNAYVKSRVFDTSNKENAAESDEKPTEGELGAQNPADNGPASRFDTSAARWNNNTPNRKRSIASSLVVKSAPNAKSTPKGNVSSATVRRAAATAAAPVEEDPECTFTPHINRASSAAKSRYLAIEAMAKKKEMRLAQLSEELMLERERKEWGLDEPTAGGGADGPSKGVPSASDLTPRRPFSPSITRRTAELAKAKQRVPSLSRIIRADDGLADGDGERQKRAGGEGGLLKHQQGPSAYQQYLTALARKKEIKLQQQRNEQRLLEEEQLTFKPVIHDVPERIRELGRRVRSYSDEASRSNVPVYRAQQHTSSTVPSSATPSLNVSSVAHASNNATAHQNASLHPGSHRAAPKPSLGMRFT